MPVQYYVLAADGSQYGPADIATLNQWIAEGRILRATVLQDFGSGVRNAAGNVPGLIFPTTALGGPPPTIPVRPGAMPPSLGPSQSSFSSYPRPVQGAGQFIDPPRTGLGASSLTQAWIATVASPFLSVFCIFGLASAAYGLQVGLKLRQYGHPSAWPLIIINALSLLFYVVVRFFFRAFLFHY